MGGGQTLSGSQTWCGEREQTIVQSVAWWKTGGPGDFHSPSSGAKAPPAAKPSPEMPRRRRGGLESVEGPGCADLRG